MEHLNVGNTKSYYGQKNDWCVYGIFRSLEMIKERTCGDVLMIDDFVLLVVRKGNIDFFANGERVSLSPGMIFVCNSGIMIHDMTTTEDYDVVLQMAERQYLLKLHYRMMCDWSDIILIPQYLSCEITKCEDKRIIDLISVLEDFMDEQKSDTIVPFVNYMICAITFVLYGAFARVDFFVKSKTNDAQNRVWVSFVDLVKSIDDIYRPVSEYADSLCVSSRYLSVCVSKFSGKTCSALIDELAMIAVSRYLLDKDLSIGQIAGIVGFGSQQHLTVFFKKYSGVTPQEFRVTGGLMFPLNKAK